MFSYFSTLYPPSLYDKYGIIADLRNMRPISPSENMCSFYRGSTHLFSKLLTWILYSHSAWKNTNTQQFPSMVSWKFVSSSVRTWLAPGTFTHPTFLLSLLPPVVDGPDEDAAKIVSNMPWKHKHYFISQTNVGWRLVCGFRRVN